MSRPRKAAEEHRARRFTTRYTEAEAAALEARAAQAGVSVSDFIRAATLSDVQPVTPRRRRAPVAHVKLLAQGVAQLGKIGSNLNQMAHVANCGGWPHGPALERALAELRDAQAGLMAALGCNPPTGRTAAPAQEVEEPAA